MQAGKVSFCGQSRNYPVVPHTCVTYKLEV